MSWPLTPVLRRASARRPIRRLKAELRFRAGRRSRALLDRALDVVVSSLVGRESVHRLTDDIVRHLAANPNVHHLIDEIVDYIAVQPAVRELVQEQGQHYTEEVVGEMRQHLHRADAAVEHLVSAARDRLRFVERMRKREAR